MKKILFIFTLAFLAMFGANAQQTVITVDPSNNAGIVEVYPAIEDITYDTVGDTNVCIDTIFSEHYKDLRAVAAEGWTFQYWCIKYVTNDSVPEADTIIVPDFYIDEETGDTIDMEGWLEYIPWLDSLWDGGFSSFNVTANFIQEDTDTVGIGDVRHQFEYLIYPNPTSGLINIQGDIQQVSVFDITGRLITTGKRTIDITKQPAGTYFLHITDLMGSVVVTKVIKK